MEIKSEMGFDEVVDKWIVSWEHKFNEMEKSFKEYLGEDRSYDLVDKLNPRDSVKGGRTEVFQMYCLVRDEENRIIQYLDVNLLYSFVMSSIDFLIGHPEIRRGDESCRNLLCSLDRKGEKFIGICQVPVLAPDNLFLPSLAHK